MRTTVTIDADTEHLLREEVRRTGHSFKGVLNQSIRRGLSAAPVSKVQAEPVFAAPFPPELATSLNRLADELDDDKTLWGLAR